MTQCECPISGFCARHNLTKPDGWHKLCQTRESYYAAWEAGRGPGQKAKQVTKKRDRREQVVNQDGKKEARRKRIKLAVEQRQRLISWLKFFRAKADRGVGDTAARLQRQRKKSKPWVASDASKAIRCLLAHCSCSRVDAVARLNEQWPYQSG